MGYTLRSGLPAGRIDDDLGSFEIDDGELEVDDYETAAALARRHNVHWPVGEGDPGPPDAAESEDADADAERSGDVESEDSEGGDEGNRGAGSSTDDSGEAFDPSGYTLSELEAALEESDLSADELHEREREGDDRKGAHEMIDAVRGGSED